MSEKRKSGCARMYKWVQDPERPTYTKSDHRSACGLPSCQACGSFLMERWVDTHQLKGLVIKDPIISQILEFPKRPLASGSSVSERTKLRNALLQDHKVLDQFFDKIKKGSVGRIIGWAAGGHFTFHAPNRLGHHVHLAIVLGNNTPEKVRSELGLLANYFGIGLKIDDKDHSSLSGFFAYMRHQPFLSDEERPESGFDYKNRKWVQDVLVSRWHDLRTSEPKVKGMTKTMPALVRRAVAGRALGPYTFRRIRARAHMEARGKQLGLKGRISYPDGPHSLYLAGEITNLAHIVECPDCGWLQNPVDFTTMEVKCGRPGCRKVWRDEPVMSSVRKVAEKNRKPRKH